eukprot:TRINITY_DN10858_c2_g3_i1.p1 TRINITY_DN10858_c2_g3~~TRINITY_DN10858_c2_g3_i1.p1  ORF type:complete len:134 (+),score=8.38 TRINITY_DN10858_c2_g3_i1:1119-1520(+)
MTRLLFAVSSLRKKKCRRLPTRSGFGDTSESIRPYVALGEASHKLSAFFHKVRRTPSKNPLQSLLPSRSYSGDHLCRGGGVNACLDQVHNTRAAKGQSQEGLSPSTQADCRDVCLLDFSDITSLQRVKTPSMI